MPRHLTEDDLTRLDAERDAYRHIGVRRVPAAHQAETALIDAPLATYRPTHEMACVDPDPEPRNPAKRSRWKRFVRDLARWLRRSRLRM